jgi:hypothetical protein
VDLYDETHAALDISAAAAVLTYTYTGSTSRAVAASVTLGSDAAPIAGGANYDVVAKIGGVPVTPVSRAAVPAGTGETVLQSRQFVLRPGNVLTIEITGDPTDTAVATFAHLVDFTPVRASDFHGDGSVAVDHDYGGVDAMRYLDSATLSPIDNGTVKAYLAEDYAAYRRGQAYVKAQAVTDATGRWAAPMMLDPADWVLVFYRQGSHLPTVVELAVEEP